MPKTEAKEKTEAVEEKPEAPKTEAKEKAPKKAPYTVAEGKSLTVGRKVFGEDEEVKAEQLSGGQKALDKHVELGTVDKN